MAVEPTSTKATLKIRLPQETLDALHHHAASQAPGDPKPVSHVIAQLLEQGIARAKGIQLFALTHLVADAIRAATPRGQRYTTLAQVRAHVGPIPRIQVDLALRELERQGLLTLEAKYNGNDVTEAERAAGIRDGSRGLLLFALPAKRNAGRAAASRNHSTRASSSKQRARAS